MNQAILECGEIKEFDKLKDIREKEQTLSKIYDDLESDLNFIKKHYKKFLEGMIKKKNKKRVKIIVCIKPLSSLQSKVIGRNRKLSSVKDLVRATILLGSDREVENLYCDIQRKKSEVIRSTHKHKGGDSLFGYYGSYHIIFFYKGLNVELQLMTRKLWSYKDVAHELYEKYRDEESPNIDNFDLHTSKMLFSKGNKPKHYYKKSEVRENYKKLIPYFK